MENIDGGGQAAARSWSVGQKPAQCNHNDSTEETSLTSRISPIACLASKNPSRAVRKDLLMALSCGITQFD